jgi:FKBP-type peptidyl-prolyl cis-trans isomerases 1
MKKFSILCLCLALFLPLAFADGAPTAPATSAPAAPTVDPSYALGMLLGANIKTSGLELDGQSFLAGVMDVVGGKQTKCSTEEAQASLQAAFQVAHDKKAAANLAAGKAFLEKNKSAAGVKVTDSGLQYEVISLGTGPKPTLTDTVKVDYEGKFLSGDVFDSSIKRGEPAVFPITGVIPGWTEALQLMPVGSKYRIYLPSELAYGAQGAGDVIEPNTVLVFEVSLLSIEPPEAPAADAPATGAAGAPAGDAPAAK